MTFLNLLKRTQNKIFSQDSTRIRDICKLINHRSVSKESKILQKSVVFVISKAEMSAYKSCGHSQNSAT